MIESTKLDALRIEAMAVAICNTIRRSYHLRPIVDLDSVEDPDKYRNQARAALTALRTIE